MCRLFGSQLVRVFCHLSTHSLKARLLAAAGQLNLNLDSRAKQGHHKKSVQFHLRDDAWPSRFLQRHILMEISQGWRPLTCQARGARQPLPEPTFISPPITQADLQHIQVSLPKDLPKEDLTIVTSVDEIQKSDDSDQRGESD